MKKLVEFANSEVKNLHRILGGEDNNDVITEYIETDESDDIGKKTYYTDPNGAQRVDRKVLGIVIKINPGS